jgi:uncharacterized membrane protein YphA (DoxX/SURF4 family)/peroxiredoxin
MATVVLGARLVLAVVFVTAGVGKLLDLSGSRRAVSDFGVPERMARVAGTLLPIVELASGLALVFRPSARWGAVVAVLLLAAFIAGISRALARGEEPDCHCFGQIHSSPAGPLTLARNAVLAALAVVIVAYGSGPAVDAWVNARSAAELVAAVAVICAGAAVAYALSLRAETQRLTRDLSTAQQAAAAGRPGLPVGMDAPLFELPSLQGEPVALTELVQRGHPVLLVFMTPWCGPCEALVPNVRQWQQTLSSRITIAPISAGTAEQNTAFAEQGLENVLLQDDMEIANMYGVKGTPSALFVSSEGKVASTLAEAAHGIEPLVRLALRGGDEAPVEGSVA